jgi:hypothetical protein
VLVVSDCSARKRLRPPDAPSFEELMDPARRPAALERMAPLALPASQMYTGAHHVSVMRSLSRLRAAWPARRIDLAIVSAGYGVLDEHQLIVPYEASFSGLPRVLAVYLAQRLAIAEQLRRRLANYEVCVVLLGGTYLTLAGPPLRADRQDVYFAAADVPLDSVVHVRAGVLQAKAMGVAPRMARAALFSRFVDVAAEFGWTAAVGVAAAGELSVGRPRQFTLELA